MSPSMNKAGLQRWRRALAARLAKPRRLWLSAEGQIEGQAPADWAAAHAGSALELIVAEPLQAQLVCEPGLPLADAAALQGYARQLFSHYFGSAAQRWALADWRLGDSAGASALSGLDLAGLQQALQAQQLALRSAQPAWAALLPRLAAEQPDWWRAPRAALAWVEGGLLCWLELRAGAVRQLRHLRLAAASLDALHETLAGLVAEGQVLLLGYGLDGAQLPPLPGLRQLAPLNLSQPRAEWFERPAKPAPGLPQPDFLPRASARSPLAWPLAAVGALVLATAAWSAWEAHAQRAEAQALVARLQAGPALARPLPAATPRRGPDEAQQRQLRAAAEVQGLLLQPWGLLLSNVEQAGAGDAAIAWLGLDYQAARQELRLEGISPDQAQALRLVERLAAAPGWGEVVLSRFQAAGEGQSGQRFDLAARLRPERLAADLPLRSGAREARP